MADRTAAGPRVQDRFARQVHERARAVAVCDGTTAVTYAELDAAASQVAETLVEEGVPPGGLVGLRMRRGWRVVAAILGIWKHGCAYVPVDPDYPQARQDYIVGDAGLAWILHSGVDGRAALARVEEPQRPVPVPADAAYVIYTSGSTGDPKGVVVSHRNVIALFEAADEVFDFGPDDVWSQFHSHNFDFSVWEVWGPLLTGGRCVIVPAETARDPYLFAELLSQHEVTILNQVPSVFGYLALALADQPRTLPALRRVIFGGEPIDVSAILRWADLGTAPQAQMTNMYGITETTVHVTVKHLDLAALEPAAPTPVGKPLPHLRVALAEDGKPVAPGEPGEIHVAGDSVAWGYLGRPEATAAAFVRLDGDGDRWYRSGDYAVQRADGELTFVGRRDAQVKVRGHRIELGEIEAALGRHPGVRECAVVVAAGRAGDPVLAAAYVPAEGDAHLGPALRDMLRAVLPGHMVPTKYTALSGLPLTLSGKLDRSAVARRLDADAAGGG